MDDKQMLADLRTITPKTADHWSRIATCLRQASELIDKAHLTLVMELAVLDGKPLETIERLTEEISGLAYMFTPQTEWTGGDSSDPKNFKHALPHIARGALNQF